MIDLNSAGAQREQVNNDTTGVTHHAEISLFTSSDILTKRYLYVDGALDKHPGGHMKSGQVECVAVRNPEGLADMVQKLTAYQALGFGVCPHRFAQIICQNNQGKIPQNITTPIIARTAQNFSYHQGHPGILMLDVDPPKDETPPLSRLQAIALVCSVCPELATAPMLICDSASSHIWNSETNEELIGPRGLRIYVFVADASDIPRAGQVLFKKLWLAGCGRIELSSPGSMLVRGPIDAAVWQPERLDFAAGAACEPPLEQRRPAPETHNNTASPIDTLLTLPDLTSAQEREYQQIVHNAKERMKSEADRVREQWLCSRTDAELSRNGITRTTHPQVARKMRDVLAAAAETHILIGEVVLYLKDGQVVTVGEVLADPGKYDGMRCADPLDPGCYNDGRIALIILDDDPRIYSHAHGGQVYRLSHSAKDTTHNPGKVSPREKLRALTVQKEYVAMLGKETWLLQNLIIKGQILTIIAKSGGGKTSVFFDFVAPWIIQHHGMTVYYFDCDSPASDHDRMLTSAEEIGPQMQWVNPLTHGKGPEVLVDALKEFVAIGERLDDAVFILDTLKKFIDMLDKKSVKPFFCLLRQLTALGATIILLGHANKHRDNNGNLVFEGVGDVLSDTDAMLIFERMKSAEDGGIDITTVCDPDRGAKVRGAVFANYVPSCS